MAAGSVLITGANGSLAIPSVEYLLSHYPSYTAVLTVRSEEDENSQRLREVISHFPDAKASVRPLDLSSLSAVQAFAVEIAEDISAGEIPPLAAIICNAFTWSISDGVQFTADGHETSFAVNYLAHLSLVLRLLGYFGSDGGRVTFLASDAHYPGKNGLEKYPPSIPEDLDLLVQPPVDVRGEEVGRGFQRYGVSKLAVIMGMYELNRRLARDQTLSKVTALAMDPGGLTGSRCMDTGVPFAWKIVMKVVLGPLQPVLKYLIPTLRPVSIAAADLIEISVGEEYRGESGYYVMLQKDISSPESNDEVKQQKLWTKSLAWAEITEDQTALKTAF